MYGDRELNLKECGVDGNSCVALCISTALTGDGSLSGLVRRLAAISVLAFPDEVGELWHGRDSQMLRELISESKDARQVGNSMTPITLKAVAYSLGLSMAYRWNPHARQPSESESDSTEGAHDDSSPESPDDPGTGWQAYWPSQDDGQLSDELPQIIIHHTGSFHFMLAFSGTLQPIFSDRVEAQSRLNDAIAHAIKVANAIQDEPLKSEIAALQQFWSPGKAPKRPSKKPGASASITTGGGSTRGAPLQSASADRSTAGKHARSATDHGAEDDDEPGDVWPAAGSPAPRETSWKAICSAAAECGNMFDLSERARKRHAESGSVRCTTCGFILKNARRSSMSSHHNTHLSTLPDADEDAMLAHVVPRLSAAGTDERDAADIVSMLLATMGLSVTCISAIKDLLPLLHKCNTLPSRTQISRADGTYATACEQLKDALRKRLAGIPVILTIDGSNTRYAGRKKIVNILADSVLLDAPMLLDVRLEREASLDAAYYGAALDRVILDYGISRDNVVGVATDNTSTMPNAVINVAKLQHIPCAAHVINLMLKAIAVVLGVADVLGFRKYLANSGQRQHDFLKDGLHPRLLMTPEHRFAYVVPALKELCENWNAYAAHFPVGDGARASGEPKSNGRKRARLVAGDASAPAASERAPDSEATVRAREDSANMATLREKLNSPMWHARVALACELCIDGARLCALAEADSRALVPDFWRHFKRYLSGTLHHAHKETEDFVTDTLRIRGIEVPAADSGDFKLLCDLVARAVEDADIKVHSHLMPEGAAITPGEDSVAFLMKPFVLRDFWARSTLAGFAGIPNPKTDRLHAALGEKYSRSVAADYEEFFTMIQDHDRRLPMDLVTTPVLFWRAMYNERARIGLQHLALLVIRILTVPVSSGAVERSFSVLANREIPNRLHAGDSYVWHQLMLSCNAPYVKEMYSPRMQHFYPHGALPQLHIRGLQGHRSAARESTATDTIDSVSLQPARFHPGDLSSERDGPDPDDDGASETSDDESVMDLTAAGK